MMKRCPVHAAPFIDHGTHHIYYNEHGHPVGELPACGIYGRDNDCRPIEAGAVCARPHWLSPCPLNTQTRSNANDA